MAGIAPPTNRHLPESGSRALAYDVTSTPQEHCEQAQEQLYANGSQEEVARLDKKQAVAKRNRVILSHTASYKARSSNREVRIRVPFFLYTIVVGEPSPKKETVQGGLEGLWGLKMPDPQQTQLAPASQEPTLRDPFESMRPTGTDLEAKSR